MLFALNNLLSDASILIFLADIARDNPSVVEIFGPSMFKSNPVCCFVIFSIFCAVKKWFAQKPSKKYTQQQKPINAVVIISIFLLKIFLIVRMWLLYYFILLQ